jgi:hypothetical protein
MLQRGDHLPLSVLARPSLVFFVLRHIRVERLCGGGQVLSGRAVQHVRGIAFGADQRVGWRFSKEFSAE